MPCSISQSEQKNLSAPPCLRHRGELGEGLYARDRAGLRPPCAPPHPTPSPLRRIGLVEKTLTPKLNMIAKFTGKFLLETRGPLARNAMFPRAPSRRGMLAWQHFRAHGQGDEIVAQSPLLGLAPRRPFLDACHPMARDGKGRELFIGRTVELLCRVIVVGTGRQMPRLDHRTPPFRTAWRKRCAVKPRLVTR